jgi:two-component system KDP operon response regulator KdpE
MMALVALSDGNVKDSVKQALEVGYPECLVVYINSGKYCVEFIKKNVPNIVILDTSLKDFDTYDAIKQIRCFSEVPILVLSYIRQESQIVKALEAGADEYMVKPIHSMEMIARIRALLKGNRNPVNTLQDVKNRFIPSTHNER